MSKERHIQLSWELLEHKCRYYILCKPIIEDTAYDFLEKEYAQLCIDLNLPNTISADSPDGMVDFDTSRPSSRLVMDKLGVLNIKRKKHDRDTKQVPTAPRSRTKITRNPSNSDKIPRHNVGSKVHNREDGKRKPRFKKSSTSVSNNNGE